MSEQAFLSYLTFLLLGGELLSNRLTNRVGLHISTEVPKPLRGLYQPRQWQGEDVSGEPGLQDLQYTFQAGNTFFQQDKIKTYLYISVKNLFMLDCLSYINKNVF